MLKILRTEWLKIRNYPAFWLVMLMTALSYPGINYLFWNQYNHIVSKKDQGGQILKFLVGNPFAFPETFHTVAFFSSIFLLIPSIVVIMLITNEYTYKTNRQNIIDGWSRNKFIMGKFLDVLIITLMVTVIFAIVAYFIGQAATEKPVTDTWSQSRYIGLFALQTFAQLSLAFLAGFLIKRAFIALGVFVFYFVIVENGAIGVLKTKYKSGLGNYFPLEISDRLIPMPAFMGRFDEKSYNASLAMINSHIVYTLILLLIVWGIIYLINQKRDL